MNAHAQITTELPIENPLWPMQVELEMEMMEDGVSRFRSMVDKARGKGQEAELPHVRRLVTQFIDPVAKALAEFLTRKKRGVQPTAIQYLKQVDGEVAAYLALRHVMDQISREEQLVRPLAFKIGKALMSEVRLGIWAAEHPDIWEAYQTRLERTGATSHHRKKVLTHGFNTLVRDKVGWIDWPEDHQFHVGYKMLELLCKATSRFEMRLVNSTGAQRNNKAKPINTQMVLFPMRETAEWLAGAMRKQELMFPMLRPTAIPPKPWTSHEGGGYWTGVLKPLQLVRDSTLTPRLRKQQLKVLQAADLSTVYAGVNLLQDTPWSINPEVLAVAETLWARGVDVAGLPSRFNEEVANKPLDIDTNEAARKSWRIAAAGVHDRNAASISKRLLTEQTLCLARSLERKPHPFYYPYVCDFRGRLYPVVSGLAPHGGDLAKGLLQFCKGVAITEPEHVGWLCIQLANNWGVDKVSFDDRINWAYEHSEDIVRWATAPLIDLGWTEAEEPWQFLQACFDWAGFQKSSFGYISHQVIRVDGSCNGIQHLSAMLLDEEGGRATNLYPSEEPNDVYQEVADLVTEHEEKIAKGNDRRAELASFWLKICEGGIKRDLTKRSVMILPYGGTMLSCRQYISDWLEKKDATGQLTTETVDGELKSFKQEALTHITTLVWGSIGYTVQSASVAFKFIKSVAKVAFDQKKPLVYTSPSGFPMFHWYSVFAEREVTIRQDGSRFKMKEWKATDEVDLKKQMSGIAPNFVHANDAAMLVLTLENAERNGVVDLTSIHDSIGAHAAYMGTLSAVIRATFRSMYETHDVLDDLRSDVIAMCGPEVNLDEIPVVPQKGSLDLSQVEDALYFFA